MKLSEKGHFAPPPKLAGFAQHVSVALAAWPQMHARTHWRLGDESVVDGADFYLGEDEIGHLHLEGEAHIVQELQVRNALIKAKLASPFRWSRDFVTFEIDSKTAVVHALWLFQLRYDALRGEASAALLCRIADHLGNG
jgi:Family of unknown function (DUF5519)